MEDSNSEPREGATIMGHHLHHHNPSPKTPKNHLNLTHPTQAQAQAQLLHPRPNMEVVAYKECLKNHAASLGAHATDGCGEFIGGLLCSACGCHRNFHRKEVNDGGAHSGSPYLPQCHYTTTRTPGGVLRARPGCGPHDTCRDDGREVMKKKRHRTKFTKEQKEKMMGFAEKAEWKIHKLEEGFILKFCQEIGIKRRVLKVWMHNNKHLFVKTLTNTTHHNLSPPPNHTISNSNSSHN